METTDVTDEAAEAMKDYEKNLQKTSDTIDYQIGELERKAELEELNARKAGKSEAYINKLKRKSLADQIAYLESKKDAEDKAWFNEWEKIQLSSKSEEEKTKLQQELTEKTAQYTKKITQQIDALKHQSRVNEINEDIKLSEEQKELIEKIKEEVGEANFDEFFTEIAKLKEQAEKVQVKLDEIKAEKSIKEQYGDIPTMIDAIKTFYLEKATDEQKDSIKGKLAEFGVSKFDMLADCDLEQILSILEITK
jgi:hypothetical protein